MGKIIQFPISRSRVPESIDNDRPEYINDQDVSNLMSNGWTIVKDNPIEVRSEKGEVATGFAVFCIVEFFRRMLDDCKREVGRYGKVIR